MTATIGYGDFAKVAAVAGTVVRAEPFAEARKPALKVWVDFGPNHGELRTSAQVAALYTPEALVGRQVIGVLNLGEKRIGPFVSQFLLTGFETPDGVVLASIDRTVPDGTRLT